VSEVANKLRGDLDLVAHVCANHDQALLAIMDEVEQLRIANAQLYIRLCHLERRGQNHG
jgi:hypothetical protein